MSWLKWLQREAPRRSTHVEKRKNLVEKPFFRRSHVLTFAVLAALTLGCAVVAIPSAQAAAGDPAFEMYLDAPFVQNSYVFTDHPDEAGTRLSNFDTGNNQDPCQVNGATVTLLDQPHGCWLWDEPTYGGAITESSDPTVGNLPSSTAPSRLRYAQANGSQGVRIQFAQPQHYFGIWWSAGSVGNVVTFYSGDTVVAQTTADEVASIISSNSTIQSTSGQNYASSLYLGNPATWSAAGSPTDFSQQDPNNLYVHGETSYAYENFAYLHFFSQGSVSFDRVELSAPGNGFEFDNVVTSDLTGLTPSSRLVHVKTVNQPAMLSFDANGAQGSIPNQSSATALPYSCPDNSWQPSSNCIVMPDINGRSNPYYFDGWNTQANGSGTNYDSGVIADVSADTILYAQWKLSFYIDGSLPDQLWTSYQWILLRLGQTYVLPTENDFPGGNSWPGHHIDHYVYFDAQAQDFTIGSPGDTLTATELIPFMMSDYMIRPVWADGERATNQTPPTATVVDVIPVDPRAVTVILPPMPLTDAATASVCIDEVDSSQAPVTSRLTFAQNPTARANSTSGFTVTASAPISAMASTYLRYRVAPDTDLTCTNANEYFLELRPLNLSDRRSSTADIH